MGKREQMKMPKRTIHCTEVFMLETLLTSYSKCAPSSFHALDAGAIEEVRVQNGKGFGFVRYSNHAEAALAVQVGNGRIVCGKPIKCSWGNKQTPPGATSTPLTPPAASGVGDADIIAYGRAMALSRMASNQALRQSSNTASEASCHGDECRCNRKTGDVWW
ncbi:hypothetical protein ACP70R_027884 [Stipagrostis hirtigluma subsp. patula]